MKINFLLLVIKTFTILSPFLLCSCLLKAQSPQFEADSLQAIAVFDSVELERKKRKYDPASLTKKYENVIVTLENTFGEISTYGLKAKSALADLYKEVGDLKLSKKVIFEVIEVGEANPDIFSETASFTYYTAVDILNNMGEYETSLEICDKGLSTIESPSKQRASFLNVKGNTFLLTDRIDEAIGLYKESVEEYKKIEGEEKGKKRAIAFGLGNIALCFTRQGKLDDAKTNFLEAQTLFDSMSDGKKYSIINYINLAINADKKGDPTQAMEYWVMAKDIHLSLYKEEHYNMVDIYFGMSKAYEQLQDYNASAEYANKGLSIGTKIFGSGERMEYFKSLLGSRLSMAGKLNEANEVLLSTVPFYKNGGKPYKRYLSINYSQIGKNYQNLGIHKIAEEYLKESLRLKREINSYPHFETGQSCYALAEFYLQLEEPEKAKPYIDEAVYILKSTLGEKHLFTAKSYGYLSEYYLQKKSYGLAIETIQSVLYSLSPEETSADPEKNPSTFGQNSNSYAIPFFLSQKIEILKEQFQEEGKSINVNHIIEAVEVAIKIIEDQRKNINRKESKENLVANFLNIYESGIAAVYNKRNISTPPSIKPTAFKYSEKNKSQSLKEHTFDDRILKYKYLPDNYLKAINQINSDINYLEKKIYKKDENPTLSDSAKFSDLKNNLFKLKNQHDSLVETIKNEYPKYFSLKYQNETISVETVQTDLLSPTQALIEYFTGDSAIYAFIITPTAYEIIEIKKDFPLNELVAQLQRNTYTCQLKENCTDTEYSAEADTFALVAHELYERIFSPIEKAIDLPKELIIIPDGILGYIPFEMLLRERPDNSTSFSTHLYLLKDYQISYCYSATLLHEMKKMEKGKAEKDFLAFAPSFENGDELVSVNRSIKDIRGGLRELIHNVPEVLAIQKIMGGDVFTGGKATEEAFTKAAPNYRILHLATHGKANDEIGDYAYLAFTEIPDSTENELLYNRDLYNLQLNADLVVLSACETGIGELQRGEGIISLARGFSYAGARSIVTTLWSINDQTTTELMENFYSYLKDDMPKDAALRQAKLDYLNSHPNEEAHPFYWAAFVPIGDMSPINLNGTTWWPWMLGGTILLVGVYFLRKKLRPN